MFNCTWNVCHAQLLWQNTGDPDALTGFAYDMSLDENQNVLVTMNGSQGMNIPDARTYRISPSGTVIDNIAYSFPEGSYWGSVRLLDTAQGGFDMFTSLVEPGTNNYSVYLYHQADEGLGFLRTDTMPFPANVHTNGFRVLRDFNGDLIVVGGINTSGPSFPHDRLHWLRLSTDGDSLTSRLYPGVQVQVWDAELTSEGYTLLCSMGGIGPFGPYKVLRFDHDFNYLGGFPVTDVNGVPPLLGQDSIPDPYEIVVLPNGKVLIAADFFDTWGPEYAIPCVLLYGADGSLESIRYAPGSGPRRSVFDGLSSLGNGTFSWSYIEELEFSEGNRTHVLILDSTLTTLSELVFDGVAMGIHAMPSEVLPAPDGGFYLAGYMHYVGENTLHAWIAKIGLNVGVNEQVEEAPEVHVHPNPGSIFTAFYNGPVSTATNLVLYDAQGRPVAQHRFILNRATIDGTLLSAAIYLFRATDGSGNVLGSGKWVRE